MSSPLAPEQAVRLQAAERRWLESARHRLHRRPSGTPVPTTPSEAPVDPPASASEETAR